VRATATQKKKQAATTKQPYTQWERLINRKKCHKVRTQLRPALSLSSRAAVAGHQKTHMSSNSEKSSASNEGSRGCCSFLKQHN